MHPNYNKYLLTIKHETLYLLSSRDPRFTKKLKFLEILKYMLKKDLKKTKREIFYTCPVIFKTQATVNILINHYCRKWCIEMTEINIAVSLKGLFIGDVLFLINGENKSLSSGLIPDMSTVRGVELKYSKVLVVEKDSMMSFVNEVYSKRCVERDFLLVSGKGYPDINTKCFLKRIAKGVGVRIYGLFDFDPFGLDIYRIYKEAVPSIQRIGILSSDIFFYTVNEREMLDLKINDYRKMNSLNSKDVLAEFEEDLLFLKGFRKKCEIEIFTAFDEDFIVKYLKQKLN